MKNMTLRSTWIRCALALGIFAVLVPGVFARANGEEEQHKRGNSGPRHEEPNKQEGPVVDNWKINYHYLGTDGKEHDIDYGTANVTLNADGSWNFSGQMNEDHVGSGCEFNIVFGVKSSEGTVIAFKHAAVLEMEKPQSYSWEKQGNNRTIRDNFKSFAKKHDWYGTWTCVGLPHASSGGGGGMDIGKLIGEVGTVLGAIASLF